MKYRKLGNTGTVVSSLGLGTMYFGNETRQKEAFSILSTFVEAGGDLVDAADLHVGSLAEQIIGCWFKDRPSEITDGVVLQTTGLFGGPDVNDGLLTEYGEVMGKNPSALDNAIPAVLARVAERLPAVLIDTQRDQWHGLTKLDEQIAEIERRLRQWMKEE